MGNFGKIIETTFLFLIYLSDFMAKLYILVANKKFKISFLALILDSLIFNQEEVIQFTSETKKRKAIGAYFLQVNKYRLHSLAILNGRLIISLN